MFQSNLKVLMAARRITNQQLSEETGIALSTVSKYRNNPQQIDLSTGGSWDKLCAYFDCQLGDLIEHKEGES